MMDKAGSRIAKISLKGPIAKNWVNESTAIGLPYSVGDHQSSSGARYCVCPVVAPGAVFLHMFFSWPSCPPPSGMQTSIPFLNETGQLKTPFKFA